MATRYQCQSARKKPSVHTLLVQYGCNEICLVLATYSHSFPGRETEKRDEWVFMQSFRLFWPHNSLSGRETEKRDEWVFMQSFRLFLFMCSPSQAIQAQKVIPRCWQNSAGLLYISRPLQLFSEHLLSDTALYSVHVFSIIKHYIKDRKLHTIQCTHTIHSTRNTQHSMQCRHNNLHTMHNLYNTLFYSTQ